MAFCILEGRALRIAVLMMALVSLMSGAASAITVNGTITSSAAGSHFSEDRTYQAINRFSKRLN